jgi:chloramphenicol-sensitive protein RarD
MLQYLAPTLQLFLGVFVFGEPMGVLRWVGFSMVWVALLIFTADSIAAHRRRSAEGSLTSAEESVVLAEETGSRA